jgi:hypothetical protein
MTETGAERQRTPLGDGPAARPRAAREATEEHLLLREAHGMALAMHCVFRCVAQRVTGQGREGELG